LLTLIGGGQVLSVVPTLYCFTSTASPDNELGVTHDGGALPLLFRT